MTFVTVGNGTQPFDRLLRAIENLAADGALPEPILVQAGRTSWAGSSTCEVVDFVPLERFERAMAEADIVISHGGAGTIIHGLAAGRRLIVMPRRQDYHEHVDDHQLELTRRLSRSNLLLVAHDEPTLRAHVALTLREKPHNSPASPGRLIQFVANGLEELLTRGLPGRRSLR